MTQDNNSSSNTIANSVDTDRSMLKIAVLAVLSIASLSAFGYFFKLFFQGNEGNFLLFSGLSVTIFLIIFLLQTLFIKSFKISVLAIFLSCAGLLAAFYDNVSNTAILIGIAFVFLALIAANLNGIRELKNSLKVSFWKISKTVLPKAVAAIFLFISVVYIYADSAEKKDFFISESNFNKILSPSVLVAQKFYPELDLSLTFKEFAESLAKKQIEQTPELSILPKAVKNLMVKQAAGEIEAKAVDFIGAPVSGNLKISEALYEAAKYKFNSFPENIKSIILIGIVLTIFMTLEILAMPVRLIISFLAFIIYELLLAFGFANVELEGRSKEIIILK